MPYFITDKADGCNGWATIKEDGEVMGCHTTKQAAINQMVAISIAEDMEPGGERIASGPLAVIVDIDGTLIQNGNRVEKVYAYLDDMEDTEIIVVTGRNTDDRQSTMEELDRLSIDYDRLIMNPGSTADTAEFKKSTAENLLKEYNVILAIDNNATMRRVYRDLGITALNVSDVPDTPSDEDSPDEEQMANPTRSTTMKGIKVKKNLEVRVADFSDIEMRASEDGLKMTFRGYAAVFNSPSEPLPFIERIAPGAFKRSLRSRNEIKMFVNHNMDRVLGSTRAGTLRLTEDEKGLLVEADLPNTTDGRDLSVLLERGDVSSMSFGFTVPPKGDKWSEDGMERTLTQVRLHEVSVVTGFPAYEATTASVRNLTGLAQRTNVDADALSDALTSLEAGKTLTNDQASMVRDVVAQLEDQAAANEPVDEKLNIMRKQLDLLFKAV